MERNLVNLSTLLINTTQLSVNEIGLRTESDNWINAGFTIDNGEYIEIIQGLSTIRIDIARNRIKLDLTNQPPRIITPYTTDLIAALYRNKHTRQISGINVDLQNCLNSPLHLGRIIRFYSEPTYRV